MFISVLYENRVGVKCFNQLISSNMFEYLVIENSDTTIATDNLYLAVDGLKDYYSLIGKPLLESPHFGLVKSISAGEDIRSTEYVLRRNKGTLDFLRSIYVTDRHIALIRQRFREKSHLIEIEKYPPIKVLSNNGKYYIADGKHTAATCALLGVAPKCVDITPVLFDSFFWWLQKKMGKHAAVYKKHLSWFDSAKNQI